MACSYLLLPQAQLDYENIIRHLAVNLASKQAARHFADEFDKQLELVCQNPKLYPLSRFPELATWQYRSMPIMRYRALYTVKRNMVVVAHIFHVTQDYARYV